MYLYLKLLHVAAVVLFLGNIAPLQKELLALARAGETGKMDWTRYRRLSRRWEIWGLVALLAPVLAMALMVLKPALPAP